MPTRKRTKSSVPSDSMMDSTPLCPAPDPPRRIRIRHIGRSSSSYTAQVCWGVRPVSFNAFDTACPERFMYVWGRTNQTPRASDLPTSDCQRFFSIGVSSLRASSRTQANPRLWRVSPNSASGLPSPTMRCPSFISSMQTQQGPRRVPQTVDSSLEPPRSELDPGSLQRGDRKTGHLCALGCGRVGPAQQVEQTVHRQECKLGLLVLPETPRLANRGRPRDRDLPEMLARTGEGKHVRCVVLARESSVEPAHLLIARQPDRDSWMPSGQPGRNLGHLRGA